jgi:hypothetical protein
LDQAARDPRLRAVFVLFLIAALALRIVGAMGEPWLDEIWSLHLIDEMRSGEVLSSLATDNNHYLNTLYLWLVGPDAPPLALRALSILLGTAGVAAGGWLQRTRGTATILITMALLAVCYPMVNIGSEARGYAGMLLCALLSIGLADRALEERSARLGLSLGISNVAGVLFQPLMVGMIASLGLWTVWATWREQRSLRAVYETARDLFAWTIRLLIPVVLVLGVAVHYGSGYVLGVVAPFSGTRMLEGIGKLFRFLIGLPEMSPTPLVVAVVLVVMAIAATLLRRDRRFALYVIVILVMPAAMAMAQLPNTLFPRYYLLPGLAFLLLLGDLLGSLWARAGVLQAIAVVALLAFVIGNGLKLATFYANGRGNVTDMLATVAREGPGPITSNTDQRDRMVIGYFLRRLGMEADFVAYADVCRTHPRWMLTSDFHPDMPDETEIGDCRLGFHKEAHYTAWGLSGVSWTLYRAK